MQHEPDSLRRQVGAQSYVRLQHDL
jgi:hypothetical protein